jgi:hypothetical protein
VPTKRAHVRRADNPITPETVALWERAKAGRDTYRNCAPGNCSSAELNRHCDVCDQHLDARRDLKRALGVKLWEISPLDVEPGDELRRTGSGWVASIPKALALKAELEAASAAAKEASRAN